MEMCLDVRPVHHQPLEVRLVDEYGQQLLPDALVAPADETAVRIAPTTVHGRQVAPRRPGAQDPHHGVYERSVVFCDAAPVAFFPGKVWRDVVPDPVGHVMSVQGVFLRDIHPTTTPGRLSRIIS